jgi:hypothetical protein
MEKTTKPLKLGEIAERIHAHLKRFEADPEINRKDPTYKTRRFYMASATSTGRYVSVRYINYQGHSNLERPEAEGYLAWLDAGNVGEHYKSGFDTRKRKAQEREAAQKAEAAAEAAARLALGVTDTRIEVRVPDAGYATLLWRDPVRATGANGGDRPGYWGHHVTLYEIRPEGGQTRTLAGAKADLARKLRALADAVEKAEGAS